MLCIGNCKHHYREQKTINNNNNKNGDYAEFMCLLLYLEHLQIIARHTLFMWKSWFYMNVFKQFMLTVSTNSSNNNNNGEQGYGRRQDTTNAIVSVFVQQTTKMEVGGMEVTVSSQAFCWLRSRCVKRSSEKVKLNFINTLWRSDH